MEAAVKGGFAGLSPPPPAGATKAPSPQEQMKAIEEAQAQAQARPGDVWYCVSAIWHEHWTKFCQQGAAAGEQELHPGRIDNSALAAAEGSPELGRGVRGRTD